MLSRIVVIGTSILIRSETIMKDAGGKVCFEDVANERYVNRGDCENHRDGICDDLTEARKEFYKGINELRLALAEERTIRIQNEKNRKMQLAVMAIIVTIIQVGVALVAVGYG